MLSPFFFVGKLLLFSLAVLVLGNLIQWDGKSVSDRVRSHLSSVQKSGPVESAKDWAESLIDDVRIGNSQKESDQRNPARKRSGSDKEPEFTSTERQKLRALIRELNKSTAQD